MMTIPSYRPPDRPEKAPATSKMESLAGAVAATAGVVLLSALMSFTDPVNAFFAGPFISLVCVFLGSILTIFERTRRFALGFLIASAVLIFVTAGVCTVVLASGMVQW